MTDDGTIDYSTFSRAQLVEALSRINRSRYPRNFETLKRELDSRGPEASPVIPATSKRRPFLVWLIVVTTGLEFLFMAIVGSLVMHYWDSLPNTATAELKSVPVIDWVAAGLGAALNLLATIQLFRMKRSALYLTLAAVVPGLLETLRTYFAGTLQLSLTVLAGYSVAFMICWYVWCLYRKQMLN
jgi:hypothetical protein